MRGDLLAYILGILACTRGLDRSPDEDKNLAMAMFGQSQAERQAMIAAWQDGWIAVADVQQLAPDRFNLPLRGRGGANKIPGIDAALEIGAALNSVAKRQRGWGDGRV
ncbi:MAG: hypothetical protein Q4G22_07250 [Paracoccus sp. (in: a-proteobacteria)]|uniref:hypothetical protein n=1 Tax=Paracoccus sp. TaxID=267 RepID=UPI0026DF4FF8|nr:hypothetical protein [Paracoccus sp. (in: a-proteobacteria)]MDO5631618.1 hypothetical protein [Paracoccus sp. (in: a-proteobacteria)]